MPEKPRVLTAAEQRRKEDFERLCAQLAQQGYTKTDLTVGVVKANVMALVVMLPFAAAAAAAALPAVLRAGGTLTAGGWLLLAAAMLAATVLHEGIHGLVWGCFAQGHWRAIRFGVIWQALTPYCTCSQPLGRWQYIAGAALPTVLLGFVPAAVAAATGSLWLLVLAVMMIFGGGGDFYIIGRMLCRRPRARQVLYYDHPYECGVVMFEKP